MTITSLSESFVTAACVTTCFLVTCRIWITVVSWVFSIAFVNVGTSCDDVRFGIGCGWSVTWWANTLVSIFFDVIQHLEIGTTLPVWTYTRWISTVFESLTFLSLATSKGWMTSWDGLKTVGAFFVVYAASWTVCGTSPYLFTWACKWSFVIMEFSVFVAVVKSVAIFRQFQ